MLANNLGLQLLDAVGMGDAQHVTSLRISCHARQLATLSVEYAMLEKVSSRIVELLRAWRLVPLIQAEGEAVRRKAAATALLAAVQSEEGRQALRDLGLQGLLEEIERE